MRAARSIDNELRIGFGWFVLAGIGWWVHALPLALLGMLGALTTVALYVWQRYCLDNLTYRRHLSEARAQFAERVELEIELVNDKLLPLSWLRVEDEVPVSLPIEGGTVVVDRGRTSSLVHILPMLPYQRVRRRLTIVCSRRGDHVFGPATISSGDPIGFRERVGRADDLDHLLVYPKLFALSPPDVVSRVILGEARANAELVVDPSRVIGVREYQPGDPLRYVNWRATARTIEMLVHRFEPSATPRVALFCDISLVATGSFALYSPVLEFIIAVSASVVSDLLMRKVPTGLYSPGTVSSRPIAFPPSATQSALPNLLEALARAVPGTSFAESIATHGRGLQRGTSAVLVAADFSEQTRSATSELRRRYPVTAIWVETPYGSPPSSSDVDALLYARYADDWPDREILELAP